MATAHRDADEGRARTLRARPLRAGRATRPCHLAEMHRRADFAGRLAASGRRADSLFAQRQPPGPSRGRRLPARSAAAHRAPVSRGRLASAQWPRLDGGRLSHLGRRRRPRHRQGQPHARLHAARAGATSLRAARWPARTEVGNRRFRPAGHRRPGSGSARLDERRGWLPGALRCKSLGDIPRHLCT